MTVIVSRKEHQSRYVRRTRISLDPVISPFVLDPSSVSLQKKRSTGQYDATYLHTAAVVTQARSHREALQICEYMERLRHPHLEQFIGVVTGSSLNYHMIVTERHRGYVVAAFLQPPMSSHTDPVPILDLNDVLLIAKQAALALHYLHQITKTGHHALCSHSIVFDKPSAKTVVLLTTECRKCHRTKTKPSRRSDVQILAQLVLKLLYPFISRSNFNTVQASRTISDTHLLAIAVVRNQLTAATAATGNTGSTSMADLCKLFADTQNKIL